MVETDDEVINRLSTIGADLQRNMAVVLQAVQGKKLSPEDKESLKKYISQVERWNENLTTKWRIYIEATRPQSVAPMRPEQVVKATG